MIFQKLVTNGSQILKNKGIKNHTLEAELLLLSISKKDKFFFLTDSEAIIDFKNSFEYLKIISRRKKMEPIAYILNNKEFWSLDFFVDRNVLIPRPDTEILIEDIINRFKNKNKLFILDIGTGSGCILLSILKEFKNFKGIGIDKSSKAIKIANYNSIKLGLNERSKFINCNIDNYRNGKYDIIVSNPPYICSHRIKYLSEEIKEFEPKKALDGGISGLEILEKIIIRARKLLKIGGFLYLEIGYDQSRKVDSYLKKNSFKIVKKLIDYGNKIRCIISTRTK